MNNKYITIDGVEYLATPVNNKLRTGYERVENGGVYYSRGASYRQRGDCVDDCLFNEGLYETDKGLSEDNKRADALFRKLRQWQALNDKPVDWNDIKAKKWYISYNYQNGYRGLYVENRSVCACAHTIYFSSRGKVEEVLEVFKPELLWYFTKYRQRLDEPAVV